MVVILTPIVLMVVGIPGESHTYMQFCCDPAVFPPVAFVLSFEDLPISNPAAIFNVFSAIVDEEKYDSKAWSVIDYIADYTTHFYRDYDNPLIRIPMNQPGFNGKKVSNIGCRSPACLSGVD